MSTNTRTIGFWIALGMLVAWTTLAAAQNPGGRGGMRGRGMGGGMGSMMLLMSEQVQKELKITDEQKTKLQALAEKARDEGRQSMSGLRDLPEEERDKKMAEMQAEMQKRVETYRKEVATILKPDQVKRLRQIELQQLRTAALLQPEVAEAIGLTDQQKAKLEEINAKQAEAMQSLRRERGGDREQNREKGEKLRNDADKQAMAVLNPEQKKKLGEMMGEPFELDRSQFGFGRNGNRGRGAGQ